MNDVMISGILRKKPKIVSLEPLIIVFHLENNVFLDGKTYKHNIHCRSTKSYAKQIVDMNLSPNSYLFVDGFYYHTDETFYEIHKRNYLVYAKRVREMKMFFRKE